MKNWMILATVLMTVLGSNSVRADQYKATALYPANEAGGIGAAAVLQWEAPELVVGPEYTVYFGTDPNFDSGPVAGMPQTATEYDPFGAADMEVLTEYFWRIDVYDPNVTGNPVTHQGDRWSFNVALLPGLVMYYDFEGDPNDTSGNGYHGSLQGDAVIVDDAVRGNVLSLDGTDGFMNLVEPKTAADLGIDGNKPKSMTAWIYPRSFNNGGLFDVGAHSGGQEFCLRTMGSGETFQWRIQYHGGEYDLDFFCLSVNEWVHFALVYDGTDTQMYVNGILTAEAPRALNTTGSDPFRVGQYGGDEFDGLIDDFALWDIALSQEDVRRLMPIGDLDASGGVDAADLKTFTDDWLTSTATPVFPGLTLEDFEAYSSGDIPGYPNTWFHYPTEDDCPESSGTPSLLIGDPGASVGNQALRFDYDYPAVCTDNEEWILVGHFLPHVDLAQYDELKFWARTPSTNSQTIAWVLSLVSDFGGGAPHLVATFGPYSPLQSPDAWTEIVVDMRNDPVDWGAYGSIDNVQYINGVVVTAINVAGGVAGQLTVDIDDIRLFDYTPGCSARTIGNFGDDCIVDKADFAVIADVWMQTSMGL